jgi:hypothetical protein
MRIIHGLTLDRAGAPEWNPWIAPVGIEDSAVAVMGREIVLRDA